MQMQALLAREVDMPTITIRNLNEKTKRKLREQAAHYGHSMEEEARRILTRAVTQEEGKGLGSLIREKFKAVGGVDLELLPRSPARPAPGLEDET